MSSATPMMMPGNTRQMVYPTVRTEVVIGPWSVVTSTVSGPSGVCTPTALTVYR